jgi:hypothetical protein
VEVLQRFLTVHLLRGSANGEVVLDGLGRVCDGTVVLCDVVAAVHQVVAHDLEGR